MFFIDVQGTLISDIDKSPLPGACELIAYLNQAKIPYVVITNNTKDLKFLNFLNNLGLEIPQNRYLDPLMLFSKFVKDKKIAAFGALEFVNALKELGYEIDFHNSKNVAIASWDKFSFDDFALMIENLQNGANLIALHQTSIYKKNEKKYPGVGAICSMLESATGAKPSVVGKPSYEFYKKALELIGCDSFDKICIISDDARGDLIGAKKLGMQTALVLTGKVSSPNQAGVDDGILDKIYNNLDEFLKDLKQI